MCVQMGCIVPWMLADPIFSCSLRYYSSKKVSFCRKYYVQTLPFLFSFLFFSCKLPTALSPCCKKYLQLYKCVLSFLFSQRGDRGCSISSNNATKAMTHLRVCYSRKLFSSHYEERRTKKKKPSITRSVDRWLRLQSFLPFCFCLFCFSQQGHTDLLECKHIQFFFSNLFHSSTRHFAKAN